MTKKLLRLQSSRRSGAYLETLGLLYAMDDPLRACTDSRRTYARRLAAYCLGI